MKKSLINELTKDQERELVEFRARMWRQGVPILVTNLYFGHIQNYPEWIQISRDYVPSSVTNAQ